MYKQLTFWAARFDCYVWIPHSDKLASGALFALIRWALKTEDVVAESHDSVLVKAARSKTLNEGNTLIPSLSFVSYPYCLWTYTCILRVDLIISITLQSNSLSQFNSKRDEINYDSLYTFTFWYFIENIGIWCTICLLM